MLKVCIAIEKFDPSVGGAERYCWDLAHYLAGKGIDMAVICMRAAQPETEITVHRVRALRFPQGLRHLTFAILHHRLARAMPDYVHFGVGNTCFMDVYQPHGGLHKAWFRRDSLRYPPALRPLLSVMKRLSFKDMVQRGLEWWTFSVTKPFVIAISVMVAQDIVDAFSYAPDRIRLIPNGIDQAKFDPANASNRAAVRTRYGLEPNEFVFLFVANNLELKGFSVLLEACAALERQRFRVLVIGAEDKRSHMRAACLDRTIVFGGRAHDLEQVYPACDCLVHPSFYDACSLVVLEALASGIPVITTTANGAGMFVDGNGCVIPAGDPAALAAAMRQAYSGELVITKPVAFKDQQEVFADVAACLEQVAKP